eukprot:1213605-Rhodomonas_salina.1
MIGIRTDSPTALSAAQCSTAHEHRRKNTASSARREGESMRWVWDTRSWGRRQRIGGLKQRDLAHRKTVCFCFLERISSPLHSF